MWRRKIKYLTVKELKDLLKSLKIPDDAKVYMERLEDIYFEEHGWKPVKLKSDVWYNRYSNSNSKENENSDWIEVYEIFYNKKENALKITPHY